MAPSAVADATSATFPQHSSALRFCSPKSAPDHSGDNFSRMRVFLIRTLSFDMVSTSDMTILSKPSELSAQHRRSESDRFRESALISRNAGANEFSIALIIASLSSKVSLSDLDLYVMRVWASTVCLNAIRHLSKISLFIILQI